MPALDVRLRLVRRLPRPARIAALESALAVAGQAEGSEIALQLLNIASEEKPFADLVENGLFKRRRQPTQAIRPLLALLRAWPILGEDERTAAVAIAGTRIAPVLELMADDRRFAHRIAVATIASSHPTPDTIPILAKLIIDTDDDVATAAESAIETISSAADGFEPATIEALDQLLAEAGRSFNDHRKPGVISAIATRMNEPGAALANWLLDEHQQGLLALRGLFRRDKSPKSANAAIKLLDHPTLRGAARTRLENITTEGERRELLVGWPGLLNPERRRALTPIRRPDQLLPSADETASLDDEALVGLSVWTMALRLRPDDRARRLTRIAIGSCDHAAFAAIRRLAALPRPDAEARSGLFQSTSAGNPALAALAASALIDDRSPAARTWMQALERSPQRNVRAIATMSNRRFNPWITVIDRNPFLNTLAARRALSSDREAAIGRLRDMIRKGDADSRIRAMRLAERLRVERDVELELLKALAEDDTRIVASATLTLRRLGTSAARSALLSCVEHPDARVAANAIEAIAWSESDHPRVTLASDHDNARTRANALRARLVSHNDRGAVTQLRGMLADDRSGHRLSALWVAQRTAQTGLAKDIAQLLTTETDEHVRVRGHRCARLLLAHLRQHSASVHAAQPRADRLEEWKWS